MRRQGYLFFGLFVVAPAFFLVVLVLFQFFVFLGHLRRAEFSGGINAFGRKDSVNFVA